MYESCCGKPSARALEMSFSVGSTSTVKTRPLLRLSRFLRTIGFLSERLDCWLSFRHLALSTVVSSEPRRKMFVSWRIAVMVIECCTFSRVLQSWEYIVCSGYRTGRVSLNGIRSYCPFSSSSRAHTRYEHSIISTHSTAAQFFCLEAVADFFEGSRKQYNAEFVSTFSCMFLGFQASLWAVWLHFWSDSSTWIISHQLGKSKTRAST